MTIDRSRSTFGAERFPEIELKARAAGDTSRLIGDLTIRGVSRPIELALRTGVSDDGSVRLRADGSFRRSEFGLEWDALRQAGRVLVSDEVRVRADVVFDQV
jgi:polyisoprenoid-binding protein YceI